jgi:hypothetical protein
LYNFILVIESASAEVTLRLVTRVTHVDAFRKSLDCLYLERSEAVQGLVDCQDHFSVCLEAGEVIVGEA